MKAIDRKVLRDLARLWGQALTIAFVLACGIACYVALRSAYSSLLAARDAHYQATRFADVFAHLERAPDHLVVRLEAIPGVAIAETRIVEKVMFPLDDLPAPATGRIVSLPPEGTSHLSALHLVDGRLPEGGRSDEVVVNDAFARAHGLRPADTLPIVVNGIARRVRVTGLVLSPEYVFAIAPGDFAQDDERFGVLWMDRSALAPAFRMEASFNDVVLRLQPGASAREVVAELDRILAPFGGFGASDRSRQLSNYVVQSELTQLEQYATIAPAAFLLVAAFLVNVVLSRLVNQQRGQIATLKAVGYSGWEVAAHFAKLVFVIALGGSLVGVGLGAFLGRGMLELYGRFFHFPEIELLLDPRTLAVSVAVSVGAAFAGSLGAVRRVAGLPPAEAMQPEAPPTYRPSWLERMGLGALTPPAGRMVLRELTRRPWRTTLSTLGIALATATIIAGRFAGDAMQAMMDLEYGLAQRDDLRVGFTHPIAGRAERELAHYPGVVGTEPLRVVGARLRHAARFRDAAIMGHPPRAALRRVAEFPPNILAIPDEGALLSAQLADALGVAVGDLLTVEVLEGDRRVRQVPVVGLTREMFGHAVHMSLAALHRLLGEEDQITDVLLSIAEDREPELQARLKRLPAVASVRRRSDVLAMFERQSAEQTRTVTLILTLFGGVIAVGIVYNAARIALSMRARDLASLRVLGFTRREISAVLLGELATYVLLGLAPGMLLGRGLAWLMMSAVDQEIYRIPAIVGPSTYAFASLVTVGAAVVSALLVRRRLDRLDLVGVLKTRE